MANLSGGRLRTPAPGSYRAPNSGRCGPRVALANKTTQDMVCAKQAGNTDADDGVPRGHLQVRYVGTP
ncbi:hypothetical protein NDU88_006179 [Pleurodeles waltl]|uniref:Uncharacterized protein n=1 Tax=Pleurodeles waltl TaxID=8319 RepID=A0AAV7N044_PLEWA|nr:hypothetical protein NDU88_006179 [Pleurodeles waltl]